MSEDEIILITGYKGTGKDSLYKFSKKSGKFYQGNDKVCNVGWLVYCENPHLMLPFCLSKELNRFAFADVLKMEVHDYLKLEKKKPDAYESEKNTMLMADPNSGEVKTLRQHYIDFGQMKRKEDKLYWCKKLNLDQGGILTDWRFKKEYEYMKNKYKASPENKFKEQPVWTIRLFRSEVPIPDKLEDVEEDSEHNLDSEKTNFLLVPSPVDFKNLVKIMPQYSDFERFGSYRLVKFFK